MTKEVFSPDGAEKQPLKARIERAAFMVSGVSLAAGSIPGSILYANKLGESTVESVIVVGGLGIFMGVELLKEAQNE